MRREMRVVFWWETLMEAVYCGYLGIDGQIMIKEMDQVEMQLE